MNPNVLIELRKREIMILDEIDRICKKYNLRYYLMYGTLIGAVRHQGFIPWDDDIDVVMPKEDYKVFLKIAQIELKDRYFLQTSITDNTHGRFFAKIRMNNTAFVSMDQKKIQKHQGIFVDVLPLNYNTTKANTMIRLRRKITGVVNGYVVAKCEGKSLKRGYYIPLRLLPFPLVIRLRDLLYDTKGECYSCCGFFHDISDFEPSVLLPFEGKEYPAPKNYDKVLREIYGDYMQLPPPEKRVAHNPKRISFDLTGPDAFCSEE